VADATCFTWNVWDPLISAKTFHVEHQCTLRTPEFSALCSTWNYLRLSTQAFVSPGRERGPALRKQLQLFHVECLVSALGELDSRCTPKARVQRLVFHVELDSLTSAMRFALRASDNPVPRGTSETALNTKGMVSAELSR
jgi:hypothetical protein